MDQITFTLLVVFGLSLSAVSAVWALQQREEEVGKLPEGLTKLKE